jgi:sulfide:quinone oxidoreductase
VTPPASRVLIAGGGPAAIELLLALRELSGERAQLELLAPGSELIVRAYDVLAPFHEGRERHYSLAQIAAELGVRVIGDALAAVDTPQHSVTLRSGAHLDYDALVVAVGARHLDTVGGAIPFRGAHDANRLKAVLMESHAGRHQRVAFIVPGGPTWPLPLYELALNTSAWLAERGIGGVTVTIVSPERGPLAMFGTRASEDVAAVLDSHDVELIQGHAIRIDNGRLLLTGGRELEVGLGIAMPRLGGPRIDGLPLDEQGFVVVDELGRVPGVERVFAAGDATTFPVKQGGIATQQADVIAELLAADLGAPVEPGDFRPVLRAVLFGGRQTLYLHAELGDRLEESSRASTVAPWPASSKLIGRRLSPYLERLEEGAGTVATGA